MKLVCNIISDKQCQPLSDINSAIVELLHSMFIAE